MGNQSEYAKGYQAALRDIAESLLNDGGEGVHTWLNANLVDKSGLAALSAPSEKKPRRYVVEPSINPGIYIVVDKSDPAVAAIVFDGTAKQCAEWIQDQGIGG